MEEVEGYQESTQSKFNYATAILQRIDYLQFKANELYLKGDIDGWFFTLKNIKFNLDGRLKDDENIEIEKIEARVNFMIPKMGKSDKHRRITIILIEIYLRYLQKKIEEWGMGLVNQKDDTHFA